MQRLAKSSRWVIVLVVVAVGAFGLTGCVADPPPSIGTATAGNAQAVVSWQPPVAAPVPITGYVVTPWIGFTRQTPVMFNSSATTETVTGLTNGATYRFTVHAVNAHGDDSAESGMSTPVTLTPRPGLYAWGYNYDGELGVDLRGDQHSPVQVAGGAANWASVSPGGIHTVGVGTVGALWAWGNNGNGEVCVGSVAAGC
jgi:hypothetical protein